MRSLTGLTAVQSLTYTQTQSLNKFKKGGSLKKISEFFRKFIPERITSSTEKAHEKIVKNPCYLLEWEMAGIVLDNFNVPMIGEDLAFEFLLDAINFIPFPLSIRRKYILKAEGFIEELLGLSGDHEIHMDEAAVMEEMLREGKTLEDIRNSYKKIPA